MVNAPGMSFSSETNSGFYRVGADEVGFAANGALGFDVLNYGGANQMNIGIGGPAQAGAGSALLAQYNINGAAYFQYYNASLGNLSSTNLYITNGNAQPGIFLESHTYQTAGYLAGASLISAGVNNAPLFVIANEFTTTPNISFLLGGRTAANTSLVLNQGGMSMYGTSSGIVSVNTQAAAGTYNFNLPITAGAAGTVLTSQGGSTSARHGVRR